MRFLLTTYTLSCIILMSSCNVKKVDNYTLINGTHQIIPEETAMINNVKSVTKMTFFNNEKIPSYTYIQNLDTSGKPINLISTNNNLNYIINKKKYSYNNEGLLSNEIMIPNVKTDSTRPHQEDQFTYNKQGLIDKNIFGKINYHFDSNGNVIEKIEKNANFIDDKTTYEYDRNGRLIKEESFYYKELDSRTIYHYRADGLISKLVTSYFDSSKNTPSVQYINRYEYNNKGLLTTEYQHNYPNSKNIKKESRIYKYQYTFK